MDWQDPDLQSFIFFPREFSISQVLLVVTPVFFAAIHFAILGKVLMMFGRKYSLVNPKFVIPFFVTLDVVSLVVQGAGSGLAGAAETVAKDVNPGGNVVVGGE